MRDVERAIVDEMLDLMVGSERMKEDYRSKSVSVQGVAFDFAELAAFKLIVGRHLEHLPIVSIDIDERANRIALEVDEAAGTSTRSKPPSLGWAFLLKRCQ
jgi:hypothetical protein